MPETKIPVSKAIASALVGNKVEADQVAADIQRLDPVLATLRDSYQKLENAARRVTDAIVQDADLNPADYSGFSVGRDKDADTWHLLLVPASKDGNNAELGKDHVGG